MTLFEYLAAAYVLILSLAVVRGFSGVAYALRPSSRYGVHIAYLSIVLANCLVSFWVFWFFRDVEWTFYRFVAVLAIPVLFYVHVSVLVPPDPSTVSSWQVHFFDVRTPLFASGAITFIAIAVGHQTVIGIPALHWYEWPVYATVGLYALGLASHKPRLHAALAFANFCLTSAIVVGVLAQKDPLAPLIP